MNWKNRIIIKKYGEEYEILEYHSILFVFTGFLILPIILIKEIIFLLITIIVEIKEFKWKKRRDLCNRTINSEIFKKIENLYKNSN